MGGVSVNQALKSLAKFNDRYAVVLRKTLMRTRSVSAPRPSLGLRLGRLTAS